jgi:MFS transporter, PAT family, beta-lactamase induction signal transducer AmpG
VGYQIPVAPAVDRYSFPRFGRRKSWLVPLQFATALVLLAVALVPAERLTVGVLVTVLLVNFLIASQDIAADALAVDLLAADERGVANGVQVAGYRLGMVIGGGLLLIAYDRFGWAATFASMALLVAAAGIPVLAYHEPRPAGKVASAKPGVRAFLRKPGVWRVMALITIYKFGEAFAGGMVRPFLIDSGFALSDIGAMLGLVGFSAVLTGGLTGGVLVNVLGRRAALASFATIQALAVAGYVLLTAYPGEKSVAYAVCALEHFASGMANVALFTCMMDWSSTETGATDYTVQASAVVMASGVATTLSGFSAGAFSYTAHFALATALAAGAVLAAITLYPKPRP